jgi:hypothetical protein
LTAFSISMELTWLTMSNEGMRDFKSTPPSPCKRFLAARPLLPLLAYLHGIDTAAGGTEWDLW